MSLWVLPLRLKTELNGSSNGETFVAILCERTYDRTRLHRIQLACKTVGFGSGFKPCAFSKARPKGEKSGRKPVEPTMDIRMQVVRNENKKADEKQRQVLQQCDVVQRENVE